MDGWIMSLEAVGMFICSMWASCGGSKTHFFIKNTRLGQTWLNGTRICTDKSQYLQNKSATVHNNNNNHCQLFSSHHPRLLMQLKSKYLDKICPSMWPLLHGPGIQIHGVNPEPCIPAAPCFALCFEGNGLWSVIGPREGNSCHSSAQSKSVFCVSLCQPLATSLYICQWAEKACGLAELQLWSFPELDWIYLWWCVDQANTKM